MSRAGLLQAEPPAFLGLPTAACRNATLRADVPGPATFRPLTVGFAAMGSSGMKRKGRKHQPKVGTRPEREYALHQSERAVAANMGVSGKGWMFWTAIDRKSTRLNSSH